MREFFWGLKEDIQNDRTTRLKMGSIEDLKKEFILQKSTEDWLRNGIEISQTTDIHSDDQTYQVMRLK